MSCEHSGQSDWVVFGRPFLERLDGRARIGSFRLDYLKLRHVGNCKQGYPENHNRTLKCELLVVWPFGDLRRLNGPASGPRYAAT